MGNKRKFIILGIIIVLVVVVLIVIASNSQKKVKPEDVFNTYISYLQNRRI